MKRALISVSDKRGLIPFTKGLKGLGFEIIATEGTARTLKEKGIPVRTISEIIGFKEILRGKVKTLHPKIFGGILALRSKKDLKELEEEGIEPIDLVIVNLYPFEKRLESMDIGGAALIRSAIKNFQNVGVVVDPEDYKKILDELKKRKGNLSLKSKKNLAKKALAYLLKYDRMVCEHLASPKSKVQSPKFPEKLFLEYEKVKDLRYGENPHQKAALYKEFGVRSSEFGVVGTKQLWGKELSFNNILDLDVASSIVREFKEPTAVIIKHTNPCGVTKNRNLVNAYQKARACDPLSAFGGVVGLNKRVDTLTAREITSTFIEAIIAPGFSPQALKVLRDKKNLRVVQASGSKPQASDMQTVNWGLLVQDRDIEEVKTGNLKVVTKRKPTKEEIKALLFNWKVVRYTKSNAIVVGNTNQTLGIGAGQASRIDAVKIALSKMQSHISHPRPRSAKRGGLTSHIPLVLASDGFFPFRDSIDEAAKARVSAIIQPGGSIKDKEIIKACDEYNIAMAFTGIRHFKH